MSKKQKKREENITLDDLKKWINNENLDAKSNDFSDEQNQWVWENITLDELEKNIEKPDIDISTNTDNNFDETEKNINQNINDVNVQQDINSDNYTINNNENPDSQAVNIANVDHINSDSTNKEPTNEININNDWLDNPLQEEIKISDNTTENNVSNQNTWDIQLGNLWTHINTSSISTINVNDSKFAGIDSSNINNEIPNDTIWINNADEWVTWDNNTDEDVVMLDKINISDESNDEGKYLDLSGWSLYDIKKQPRFKYGKITVFATLISIISIAIGILAYFYNDFITHDSSNFEWNRAYTFVETTKDFIKKTEKNNKNAIMPTLNLAWKNNKTDLNNLINSDLNYIQKKEILNKSVSDLSDNIVSKYEKLNDIKNNLTRYGFFPKDLSIVISESEPISSIQNSLIALEAIKFSSAISVFSYLDTFTTSLVQSLWIDKNEIEEKVSKVTDRWETDINTYIKNCYLNPFESDYDCDYIWDFDEYYKNLNDDFDTKFFKELIKYTDSRLEQSEIPSFTISFKEFNQKDNEITFDIEINTLKEDEAELTKKGILSPHIFILNSLINSLRQSRFIVWDDISVKTLNVTPNTYIIWSSEINVNRSVNTFTVRIKKENAVEIDDFVYTEY